MQQIFLAVYQLSLHLFWVLNCAKVALFPPLLLFLVFVFSTGFASIPGGSPQRRLKDFVFVLLSL